MPKEKPVRNLTSKLVPLDFLKGYERNAKAHPPEQVERIATSIRTFGFNSPILAQPDGTIIAGHGRLLAAIQLGLAEVPCIVLEDLSPDEARAYCLADNRLTELGEWNEEMLKAELTEISDANLDLMLAAGWTETEYAELMHDEVEDLDGVDDDAEVKDGKTVTRPGDLWILGDHKLICGDCTKAETVNRLLGDEKPHLMVTDPPYGVEYDASWRNGLLGVNTKSIGKVLNDDRSDWSEAYALFPGEVAYVWHSSLKTVEFATSLQKCDFDLRSMIVWAKDRLVPARSHYHFQFEPCWYAVRKGGTGHWNGSRKEANLWFIDKQRKNDTVHSTQKPVECMLKPIVNNSLPGDLVYEPFNGSGTTIIAAEQANRKCRAVELSERYVDAAIRRWQKVSGKKAVLESTGETFDDLEAKLG